MTLASDLADIMKPLIEDNTAPPVPETEKPTFSRKMLGMYTPSYEAGPIEEVINALTGDGYKNAIDFKVSGNNIEVYNNALATEADVIGTMRSINYKFEQAVKGKQNE